MSFLSRFQLGWQPDEMRLFRRQLAALFFIITLLNVGFYWQRAHREEAARRNIQLMVQGWDGLAWYVWMPAAPATLLLIRRFSFDRGRKLRTVAGLLIGSGIIYLVVTNTRYLLRWLPNIWLPDSLDRPSGWEVYWNTQLDRTPLDFLTYCGLFAASYAVEFYSKYRHRAEEVLRLQLAAAQLHSDLAGAKLAALRGQLHPHFLFNAFNSVSTLVRQGRHEAAVETIANLGDLLRSVVEKIDLPEMTVRQEVAFVTNYLDVERVRFGEKLRHNVAVVPEALDVIVPSFLLQPLVENAVKHGISRRTRPGLIDIGAVRRGNRLVVTVSNDGPELRERVTRSSAGGIGLKNTRARLAHAYGGEFRLEVAMRDDGGVTVTVELPWRVADPVPAPPAIPIPA